MSTINEQAKGVSEELLGEAARMWCEPETAHVVMIPELAIVIAKSLQKRDTKLELAKAFIKSECYCEMDGDTPKHCKNCQFLTTI